MKALFSNTRGLNHLWARLITEELIRNGVRYFIISPGSRSTPLVTALSERNDSEHIIHYDERAAGFAALGISRFNKSPACLICTSGSAPAHYLPAVIEAYEAGIPLIILSADRPSELRESRHNQTIVQPGMFSHFTTYSISLPPPSVEYPLTRLLSNIDYAFSKCHLPRHGPVHINCEYRTPLIDESVNDYEHLSLTLPTRCLGTTTPFTQYTLSTPSSSLPTELTTAMSGSKKGIIVVGEINNKEDQQAILRCATHLSWPVLAEFQSGLRSLHSSSLLSLISTSEAILADKSTCLYHQEYSPDVILRFGDAPLGTNLQTYLRHHYQSLHIAVTDSPLRIDPDATVAVHVTISLSEFTFQIKQLPSSPSFLFDTFSEKDRLIKRILEAEYEGDALTEPYVVKSILTLAPHDSLIFLGNSLPIRLANSFTGSVPHDLNPVVQRGASGIDGALASTFGLAKASGKIITSLIGDLTFLHDATSLSLLNRLSTPCIIVVINNDGGGIFTSLPTISSLPHFSEFFVTPHGLSFSHLCEQFGVRYFKIATFEELSTTYRESSTYRGASILEVSIPAGTTTPYMKDLETRLSKAVWRKS